MAKDPNEFARGILDTIIALVVVLLVLSLLVQSIQSLLKKLLKLKSTVVMDSLLDLFQFIETDKLIGQKPEDFLKLVQAEFQKLGRESAGGRLMMDSIAKEDLLKVVERIGTALGDKAGAAKLAALDPAKLKAEVSTWFEAVMQSFDERYTRHMKTVAVIISIVVVILLNANIFTIYRNIALNDAMRANIVKMAPQVQKQAAELNKPADSSQSTTTQTDDQAKADIKKNAEQAQQLVNDYKGLGFNPLTPQQIKNFFSGPMPADQKFFHILKVLLGWGIMVLLLSVGAPFWEDTLESLFGVKNLLRRKSDTSNVEDRGGQTKP